MASTAFVMPPVLDCPEDVTSCNSYVIVPTDPEQPCLGPFRCVDVLAFQAMKSYIKDELGLDEAGYDLRSILEVGEDFFQGSPG